MKQKYNVERIITEEAICKGGLGIIENTLGEIMCEMKRAAGDKAVILQSCKVQRIGNRPVLLLKAEVMA